MIIGSHVGMNGTEMFLGSVREALSYGANTFMVYTGAPQNTRRKDLLSLRIPEAWKLIEENQMYPFAVHAPYIINIANTLKPETYKLGVDFLALELKRTEAMGSDMLILHPGAHVGAGEDAGIKQIIRGLNTVLTPDSKVNILLETMAGKGSEIGRSFSELARIFDGVTHNDKLRVCFDTCHVHDSGYDLVNQYDAIMEEFDRILGLDKISLIHLNDSKNPLRSSKDRHDNLGYGNIGFDTLAKTANDPVFVNIPKILESPYVKDPNNHTISYAPYKYEIEMLRKGVFDPELINRIVKIQDK
ncbi:MAG: deoxyribonuclease IV [Lachnoclostridium sp.]|jgi:deoxyribonuclease-4|nr:deoxyribonuclease IV [Lachnoclostridium sp.]